MVKAHLGPDKYTTHLATGRHTLLADEPEDLGGADLGFAPDELLCAALASCTAITLRMYADRKQWPLEKVEVNVDFERNAQAKTGHFTCQLEFIGDLTEEQRARLLDIAKMCPVHRTLTNPIAIATELI